MAGIRCIKTNKGAAIELPSKTGEISRFYTSLDAMKKFLNGEYNVLWFNPKSDFHKEK